MPAEITKRSLHQRLLHRILHGSAHAPAELRACAFAATGVPEPLRPLLEKTATASAHVDDADFALARDAGFTDDQLFELVICAAVGASTRQYEAGLAALTEALSDPEAGS